VAAAYKQPRECLSNRKGALEKAFAEILILILEVFLIGQWAHHGQVVWGLAAKTYAPLQREGVG